MAKHRDTSLSQKPAHQRAILSLAIGRRAGLSAEVEVTSAGLLSIAVLVSTILLSTAVLVQVAVRETRRSPDA